MTAPRLSLATLGRAAPGVATPAFDPAAVEVAVVHLGAGAFFRAHQMEVYERRLAAGDRRWGVCGVSLRSPDVRDALSPQDGLYTLARLGGGGLQVMGGLRELLVAPEAPAAVLARLASPATQVVGLTVTEKGYHLDAEGALALHDPAVRRDLASRDAFETPVGWIVAGLRARRDAGLAPFLVLSCDNLGGNGARLRRAAFAFARARGEEALADWIQARAAFPDSMVDSITPATDAALRTRVEQTLGLHDAWPVQREAFAQWVVEDVGHPALEALAGAGVTLTGDVAGYERAKLRLLNGAHSTLAYLGLLAGLETVSDAMAEPRLAAFVEALMRCDLAPTVRPPRELALPAYIDAVLARFREPALRHRLAQIAADGSLKLPIRLLGPAEEALQAGAPVRRLATPVAAWMRLVVQAQRAGARLEDANAEPLLALAATCTGGSEDAARFLDGSGLFTSRLREDPRFRQALAQAYAALGGADSLGGLSG